MAPLPLIIGGNYKYTSSTLPVFDPYTGEVIADICRAGKDEIDEVLRFAEIGAELMASLPAHKRSALLHNLADLMEEASDYLVDIIIREGGKLRLNAATEVSRAIYTIRLSAEEAVRIKGETICMDSSPAGEKKWAVMVRVPVGIVLSITPFNFPLNQICHKAGPAFAAGNSCIIRPSSTTPLVALKFGELLLKAGFPKEAVNVVSCDTKAAEIMVRDGRIGTLSFTGSPDTGWHLRSITKARKVALELGGNAAVIVHEDADLSLAAKRIVEGAFLHAGQVCISVQRVYAHRKVFHALLNAVTVKTQRLVIGDPKDPGTGLGPMISQDKVELALNQISDAKRAGARVICGGTKEGRFLLPTILTGTDMTMDVERTEVFAPIFTINQYDLFETAVDRVNDSRYGLQAGVFTKDLSLAFYACNNIRCGGVIVNDIPTFRIDSMPYGGVKESGVGREGPEYAIREMTDERLLIFTL